MSRMDKFVITCAAVLFLSLLYTVVKLENKAYEECLDAHSQTYCLKAFGCAPKVLVENYKEYYTEYADGRWERVTTQYIGSDILEVYVEESSGYWSIHEYDSSGGLIRWVDSFGIWTPDSGVDTPDSIGYTG